MSFTPRLSAPSYTDLRWIKDTSGGYNQCVYGSDGAPSVIPNCTGYVHGRVMEIRGVNTDDSGLSFGDGVTYWNNSSNIWIQTQTPSEGAILCYRPADGSGQIYGHVAVVEQVIDNDTVVVSESNYGGNRFDVLTCYRARGWRPTTGWNVTPQGFLKNPYVDPAPPSPLTPAQILLLLSKRKEIDDGKQLTGFIRLY